MMIFALATSLLLFSPNPQGVEAEASADAGITAIVEVLGAEVGRFAVTNWVKSGPGDFEELHFTIETEVILEGAGVRTTWFEGEGDGGAFAGEVTRTLDPQNGEVIQHWFSARTGRWSTTRQALNLSATGHSTLHSGEDGFGAFEARSITTYLPEGGFDWTIERRYAGTGWLPIDRGEARLIE